MQRRNWSALNRLSLLGIALVLNLLLLQSSAANLSAAEQARLQNNIKAATTQFSTMSGSEIVVVGLGFPAGISLPAFHDLWRDAPPPFLSFHVEFPNPVNVQQRHANISATTGSWYEGMDEPWPRTVCKLRMMILDMGGADVPESQLSLTGASVISTAGYVRKLVSKGDSEVQIARVETLSSKAFALRRDDARNGRQVSVRFVPENYFVPAGCDSYVRKVKGWTTTNDISLAIPPQQATKEILAGLVDDIPNQPIELTLSVRPATQLNDVARLAEKYSIAQLRGSINFRGVEGTSSALNVSYEFGSFGPPIQDQIRRTACEFRTYKIVPVDTGPDGNDLILNVASYALTSRAVTTVKEAKRLFDSLPPEVTAATITEFLHSGTFEYTAKGVAQRVSEPIHARLIDKIPTGCSRDVVGFRAK